MAGGAIEGKGESRLVAALMAAFNTVVNGGLIPHARHGGKCVEALAVAGSKLDGIGFEKEQIGQIQVALIDFEDEELCEMFDCGSVDSDCVE